MRNGGEGEKAGANFGDLLVCKAAGVIYLTGQGKGRQEAAKKSGCFFEEKGPIPGDGLSADFLQERRRIVP
jgi:hypothetical protein